MFNKYQKIKKILKTVVKLKLTKAAKYSVDDSVPPFSLIISVIAANTASILLCMSESERNFLIKLTKKKIKGTVNKQISSNRPDDVDCNSNCT